MSKQRIGFVVHRFGIEISGGAEYQCKLLAERLAQYYDVDIYTSCAIRYPWDNYYTPGIERQRGINIFRFATEVCITEAEEMNCPDGIDKSDWLQICNTGPYCPQLVECLINRKNTYAVLIAFSYPHYTSMSVLSCIDIPIIFIPTAHDEPGLYRKCYNWLFKKTTAIVYETPEEKELVDRLFHVENKPYTIGCMGMDESVRVTDNIENHIGHEEKYIIYVGRVGFSKNYQELNRYFVEYKNRNTDRNLKMLVLGRINNGFQLCYHDDIEYLGFVHESKKAELTKNAICMVIPSIRESLSIVLLESLMLGTPVLVNARCDVTKAQCIRSNAGLWYENYMEFEAELNYLIDHPKVREEMGQNGKEYVIDNYKWDDVIYRIRNLVKSIT